MKRKVDLTTNSLPVTLARIIVGLLFIVSGFIKANDPLGLSYKMQEFFEVWNTDLARSSFFLKTVFIHLFEWLHNYSLPLSIAMIFLEIVAGIALLIGWQIKWVLRGLLVLILFFTFLTGYAFLSGKFKNCGCFGDCLPISPLTSFLKDVILFFLIVFLVLQQRKIVPYVSTKGRVVIMAFFLFIALAFQWYTLTYLPVADCLPFKKGNNLINEMKVPPGSRPDSFAIRFIYKKEGKNYEFSPSTFPPDLDKYTYVERIDKLIQKGNSEPAIKGFSLIGNSETDSTQAILGLDNALLLFYLKQPPNLNWKDDLAQIVGWAKRNNIPIYVTTSTKNEAMETMDENGFSAIPFYTADVTIIRTASRTPLTLYYLQKGTVVNKWSNATFKNVIPFLQKNYSTNLIK